MRGFRAHNGRRRAVQATVAATCVVLGVAVAAGCAGKSGLSARKDKSPGGAIEFAAAQMVAQKTVRIHATISGAHNGTADGSVEFAPALKGELTLTADDADMITNHVIYDGKTVYTAFPKGLHMSSKVKPKATWFSSTMPSTSAREKAVLETLKTDPAALVKEVLAKGRFTQAGTGKADGVDATHFTGEVTGEDAGHVDVWLDAAGLPVEVDFQSTADRQPAGSAKARTVVHFSDWGKPVTITAPPADQVISEHDEISFSMSGGAFTVSPDAVDVPDPSPSAVILPVTPPPSGASAPVTCLPVTFTLSPSSTVATVTNVCLTLTVPLHP